MLAVPPAEAWDRLMSRTGLVKEGASRDLSIGAPFRFVTTAGRRLRGRGPELVPGKTFSAVVESLNKAMLNIELASTPGHGHFLYLSLSTWGLPKADVDALGARIKSIVYGLFPQKTGNRSSGCAACRRPKPACRVGRLHRGSVGSPACTKRSSSPASSVALGISLKRRIGTLKS